MSLNWKEIDLVLSELPLAGSHLQDIRQPDFKSLVLELYSPGGSWLFYVNLSPEGCRLHSLSRKPKTPKKAQRFVEFLRSRVRGGRIIEALQLGGDRIVKLRILRGGEETLLWLRLWGGASNIIAAETDGTILDVFYRRPKRREESGGSYTPEGKELKAPEKTYEVLPHPEGTSFNSFIENFYGKKEEETLRKRLVEQLESRYRVREAKLHSALNGLVRRRKDYENPESFKRFGDLIISNLHSLKKGDRWLKAEDFTEGGSTLEIELDPASSPRENAEAYYQKYKKARGGSGVLEEEIRDLETTLRGIEKRLLELKEIKEISVLEEELRRASAAASKNKEKEDAPGLRFESNGFTILVGRTAKENDELLRRHVRGNDLWLHTRDVPGGYVFIKNRPGKSVPLETLLDAGNLAVHYSKARTSGQAELYYTHVKYLRRAKGEKTGTVLPTQEKNLSIRTDPLRLERLGGEART